MKKRMAEKAERLYEMMYLMNKFLPLKKMRQEHIDKVAVMMLEHFDVDNYFVGWCVRNQKYYIGRHAQKYIVTPTVDDSEVGKGKMEL